MPPNGAQLKLVGVPDRLALLAYQPPRRDAETGAISIDCLTNARRIVTVKFSRELATELVHSFANLLIEDFDLREQEVRRVGADPNYSKALPSVEWRGPFIPQGCSADRPPVLKPNGQIL